MRIPTSLSAALFALSVSGAFAAQHAMEMDTSMGKIYGDSKDMTLYTYDKDEMGKSNCYDACAVNWPPYVAAADAMADDEWTIIDRTDGTKQWAYEGKPLYLYAEDKKPGDMMGEGKGGVWHTVKVDAM